MTAQPGNSCAPKNSHMSGWGQEELQERVGVPRAGGEGGVLTVAPVLSLDRRGVEVQGNAGRLCCAVLLPPP